MDWKTVPTQPTHNMLVAARRPSSHGDRYRTMVGAAPDAPPIDMVLHCPSCHTQHIDAPESPMRTAAVASLSGAPAGGLWTNPPHRSHLCHRCGTIWRPADVCTNGVASITTRGKDDNWAPT